VCFATLLTLEAVQPIALGRYTPLELGSRGTIALTQTAVGAVRVVARTVKNLIAVAFFHRVQSVDHRITCGPTTT
jgi:hypothetical protein